MHDPSVIILTKQIYVQATRLTSKLPANQRQILGRRLENALLNLLEILIMAKNAPRGLKASYLIKAGATAEICEFLLQILLEEKSTSATTVQQILAKLADVQRQIGGWRKSVQ
ncbi:MAG: hypothetical protein LBM73_03695 [Candidatus Nomurabacteria bacterium]|jgi:hypothetical protein|nr:hypothetical protein [Candidatus Nomurabacteria bacterium]